jgi:hypothetical protein
MYPPLEGEGKRMRGLYVFAKEYETIPQGFAKRLIG